MTRRRPRGLSAPLLIAAALAVPVVSAGSAFASTAPAAATTATTTTAPAGAPAGVTPHTSMQFSAEGNNPTTLWPPLYAEAARYGFAASDCHQGVIELPQPLYPYRYEALLTCSD